MSAPPASPGRRVWPFVLVGAALGLALGIVVSIATDVPLAPEAGLALGALAGWLVGRTFRTRTSAVTG